MIEPGLKSVIRKNISEKQTFAVIRLPGDNPRIIFPHGKERFVITDWRGNSYSLDAPYHDVPEGTVEKETPKEDYLNQLNSLIGSLQMTPDRKIVLSRVINFNDKKVDWTEVAEDLWDNFPGAVGFLFYTPGTGFWLGATPETLFKTDAKGNFFTHALAGTKYIDEPWDKKNREEQKFVSDFIYSILESENLDFEKGETGDLVYGNLKHLNTSFTGKLPANYDITPLLNRLSPTPAVAGFPRGFALDKLENIERHDRKCYSGYITVTDENGSSSFVTIRCINFDIDRRESAIYVGGGITALSDALKELEETERKASRLLSLLKKHSV